MRALALGVIAFLLLAPPPARSENGTGCGKFAWSVARELASFAAPDKPRIASGDTLPTVPTGPMVVALEPGGRASFALRPERTPKSENWFGGMIRLPAPERPATYQVTLSADAWIDVIQDGNFVRSIGSSQRSDCPGLRKSVRFDLEAVPVILQLSGVPANAITLAIEPVE